VIFQPHQYSRTIELLDWFKTCFLDADTLIIPDIYESRDSDQDMAQMSTQIFVNALEHTNKTHGQWLDSTLDLIHQYDTENPDSSIILLLGAGNIDTLRYKIKTS
jgi:UDP-N-acetylmuramate--alanine ligase